MLMTTYRNMSAALAHRGPDAMGVAAIPQGSHTARLNLKRMTKSEGSPASCPVFSEFFRGASGFLGHHRLSIIDMHEDATQPFTDPEGLVALSYNGEVYNYIELRSELAALGHTFRTTSDTEVVLHSYLQWGTGCFEHFNGDFAIVLYDHRSRSVVGARDRFGIKPLFYHRGESSFTFSSELRGFLDIPSYAPALNGAVAYHYLVADFPTYETLRSSFLQDVYSVPTAHWFVLDLDTLDIRFTPYWDLRDVQLRPEPPSLEGAAREFDSILADAVSIRLRSDVRLGTFLSGGMDSPSIAWHASRRQPNIPTFTSVFPGTSKDEAGNVALIVKSLNLTNHCNEVVFDEFQREIESLVILQDEPFSTLNVYSQFKNLQYARHSGVKVILDGGGADEYLAGYSDYRVFAALDRNDESFLTDREKARLSLLRDTDSEGLSSWLENSERQSRTVAYLHPEFRKAHRPSGYRVDRPIDTNYSGVHHGSYLKNALLHSTTGAWMNKSIEWDNRYLDRSGMRLAIEGRVPFQDHRLVEIAISLPPEHFYNHGFSKYILRRAMRNRLPAEIVDQKEKVGFEFPFIELLRSNESFFSFFNEMAGQKQLSDYGFADTAVLRNELKNIKEGNSGNYNVWRVFNLYLWCNTYLNK